MVYSSNLWILKLYIYYCLDLTLSCFLLKWKSCSWQNCRSPHPLTTNWMNELTKNDVHVSNLNWRQFDFSPVVISTYILYSFLQKTTICLVNFWLHLCIKFVCLETVSMLLHVLFILVHLINNMLRSLDSLNLLGIINFLQFFLGWLFISIKFIRKFWCFTSMCLWKPSKIRQGVNFSQIPILDSGPGSNHAGLSFIKHNLSYSKTQTNKKSSHAPFLFSLFFYEGVAGRVVFFARLSI